jgi:hypothetical protein
MTKRASHATPAHPLSPEARELRDIRLSVEMTQRQFAQHLGCHPVDVSRWETGYRRIPKSILLLARHLAVALAPPEIAGPFVAPDNASIGLHVLPGNQCLWTSLGRCSGHQFYKFQAPIAAYRHLETEACLRHGRTAFQNICEALRLEDARLARARRPRRPRPPARDQAGSSVG